MWSEVPRGEWVRARYLFPAGKGYEMLTICGQVGVAVRPLARTRPTETPHPAAPLGSGRVCERRV